MQPQQKKLDNFETILWAIFQEILKSDIPMDQVSKFETLLHNASRLYKADKEVIRLCNVVYKYNLNTEDIAKYEGLLVRALNTRNTLHSTANPSTFSNRDSPP